MRRARVVYHREKDGWWAESPEVPGWTAAGDSFEEVHNLAHEGLPFFAEEKLFIEDVALPTEAGRINWTEGPNVSGLIRVLRTQVASPGAS
jgi:predicted RNase H-like HicB family nuclease